MYDVLGFSTRVFPCKGEDGDYAELIVTPHVNGVSLFKECFDVEHVLHAEQSCQYFMPFTCSCGVPGCIGIGEEPQLRVLDTTVEWIFPEQYFRTALPDCLTEQRHPLVWVFERKAYFDALGTLTADMSAHFGPGTKTHFKMSSSPYTDEFGMELDAILGAERAKREEAREQELLERRLMGDKFSANVHATLPDGTVLTIDFVNLAHMLSHNTIERVIDDDGDDVTFEHFALAIAANDDACFDLLRAQGPDFVDWYFCVDVSSPMFKTLTQSAMTAYLEQVWNDILFSVEMPKPV